MSPRACGSIPIEILLSMGLKLGVVVALGPPAVAVLVFEVLLNATSMFNHSNVRIPLGLDRILRWIVVTPDMHRVHHSIDRARDQQQFRLQPAVVGPPVRHLPRPARGGHEGMTIGIEQFRDAAGSVA